MWVAFCVTCPLRFGWHDSLLWLLCCLLLSVAAAAVEMVLKVHSYTSFSYSRCYALFSLSVFHPPFHFFVRSFKILLDLLSDRLLWIACGCVSLNAERDLMASSTLKHTYKCCVCIAPSALWVCVRRDTQYKHKCFPFRTWVFVNVCVMCILNHFHLLKMLSNSSSRNSTSWLDFIFINMSAANVFPFDWLFDAGVNRAEDDLSLSAHISVGPKTMARFWMCIRFSSLSSFTLYMCVQFFGDAFFVLCLVSLFSLRRIERRREKKKEPKIRKLCQTGKKRVEGEYIYRWKRKAHKHTTISARELHWRYECLHDSVCTLMSVWCQLQAADQTGSSAFLCTRVGREAWKEVKR